MRGLNREQLLEIAAAIIVSLASARPVDALVSAVFSFKRVTPAMIDLISKRLRKEDLAKLKSEVLRNSSKSLGGIYFFSLRGGFMGVTSENGDVAMKLSGDMSKKFYLLVTPRLSYKMQKEGNPSFYIPAGTPYEVYLFEKIKKHGKETDSSGEKKQKKKKTVIWKISETKEKFVPEKPISELDTIVVMMKPENLIVLEGRFSVTKSSGGVSLLPSIFFVIKHDSNNIPGSALEIRRFFELSARDATAGSLNNSAASAEVQNRGTNQAFGGSTATGREDQFFGAGGIGAV